MANPKNNLELGAAIKRRARAELKKAPVQKRVQYRNSYQGKHGEEFGPTLSKFYVDWLKNNGHL